ncbi:glutamate racemase [Uliginosibacterium sp. H3]|uniref:Glutamate racemase n=1 Tax=Uliginosibacterium silvisoli TaxID=3114758 RepID=A0ABU6K7J3_9RHOO|nr:glutamate racemase [Uliginosibacterium sp. H3]
MADPRPIGVFDSGVGGLSVLREIRARLPHEDLIYCADSGFAPYGSRSPEEIRERSLFLSEFLLKHDCKALVIACNTATAAAADYLRARWPALPIIGMEPAVKPATAATHSGVVGVLATVGTLASARFAALLDTFGSEVEVVTQPCPGLMECVERGELESPATRALLTSYVEPLMQADADVVVLGCTHYVFLRPLVQSLVGHAVKLIDTGAAVAAQLERKLIAASALALPQGVGSERFWVSGDHQQMNTTLQMLWHEQAVFSILPERSPQ